MARLDSNDLRIWAAVFGAALATVLAVHLLAYRLALPGFTFSGIFFDTYDGYTYRVWSEAFRRGGLLVDNPYSTFPVKPQYFNPVWFALGKAMKYTGLPYLPLYYLFGILAGGAMYLAVLALVREMTGDRVTAWFAFLLAGLGSGFGWILGVGLLLQRIGSGFSRILSPLFKILPSDLFCGDAFPFFSFLSFPHLSFSFFLLTMIYLWMHRATVLGQRRWALGAGLLVLLLGFSHPYHIVSLLAILGVWYLVLTVKHGRKWIGHWFDYAILALCALPPLIYFWYLFNRNPNFSSWAAQNIVSSRGLLSVLIGLGPFLILAILGMRALSRRHACTDTHLLVIVWSVVNFGLLFSSPLISFGGRLIQGLILPLAILSSWGFFRMILPRIGRAPKTDMGQVDLTDDPIEAQASSGKNDRRFLWAIPILLLTLPTYGIIVANQLSYMRNRPLIPILTTNTDIIIHQQLRQAWDFAARNLKGSNILSSEETGLTLPAFADVRSFIGHNGITPSHALKSKLTRQFYDSKSTEAVRLRILMKCNIDCVWMGPYELRVGDYDPSNSSFLKKVFENRAISIYKVTLRAAEESR